MVSELVGAKSRGCIAKLDPHPGALKSLHVESEEKKEPTKVHTCSKGSWGQTFYDVCTLVPMPKMDMHTLAEDFHFCTPAGASEQPAEVR